MEINTNNLGAVEQKQKETDFELASMGAVTSPTELPETFSTPYKGIIYHQHKTPSCGAHAGVYVKNIQEARDHSPAYLWKRIKQIDGFAPEDGTTMECIFRALKQFGVCSIDLLANNTKDSLEVYTDPSVITKEMDDDAAKSKIGVYAYTWNPTFEQIKRAIFDYKVIIMRIEISADWWTPSWKGKDILPLKKNFPGQGGHFVVATGYTKDTIEGLNEWGITWGNDGRFYFKEDYIGRVTYIGTCVDYTDKEKFNFTRTLRVGMKGTDVGVLQQILKDKGFFPKTQSVTSYFGAITFKSVKEFQKANGLTVDGIVGKNTIKALQ